MYLKMSILEWIIWFLLIPVRLLAWPYLWYDVRQRRLKKRPDKWSRIDQWLVKHHHVVRTLGYWIWEPPCRLSALQKVVLAVILVAATWWGFLELLCFGFTNIMAIREYL